MSTITTELKSLPAQRVAQASAVVPGFGPENISPVIGPLFERLLGDLTAAGVRPAGPPVASYEAIESGDGSGARVVAGFVVGDEAHSGPGFAVEELPPVKLAVATVHLGVMATIGDTWQALNTWVVDNGYELAGVAREVYLVSAPQPQEDWVTELQQPVARAA